MLRTIIAVLAALCAASLAGAREVQTLTRDWTFNYFPASKLDESVAQPAHDDGSWPAVGLPHTWSTFETTRALHPFIRDASERDDPYWWRGWGVYRKRFAIDQNRRNSKVFAEFDGVQKYSRIYLNGRLLAEHKGGYTSFSVDLTDAAHFGEENVLAVAVSNRRDDAYGGIPPMTAGNFNVYGGIYRDVRLVLKDRLHIPFQGSADHEGGTFVTTPEVSAERGVTRVRTWVRNDHSAPRRAELVTTVMDPDGITVATMREARDVPGGALVEFDQTSPPLIRPRLWSPDAPNLYRVVSQIRDGGRLTDQMESPLGFRWFHWDKKAGRLVLNGRPLNIHGTNRHQEYPWLGDAMPKRLHEEEMRQIRHDLGHNFMRTAHYPNDPFVYHLTDKLGIATIEEVPNIKSIDFSEEVQSRNLVEMIRRDRNHPSILFWSVGNETSDAADSCLAKREDPTRLVHQRKSEAFGDCVDHDHEDLDLEQLLRVTIGGWYDRNDKPLEPVNGQSAGHEEWQHERARIADGSIRGRIDGQMVAWLYADHGADREYENSPLKHVNAKGWVDLYRVPKYLYHLTRANRTTAPMVYVHPHNWRANYIGQRKAFQVDSNCREVELSVDRRIVGSLRPGPENFHTVRFDNVPVSRGVLSARCVEKPNVVHRVRMAGKPARVLLTVDRSRLTADRADVAIVTAMIVDRSNVPVIGASDPLRWTVVGPGRLVGAELYTTDKDKRAEMDGAGYIVAPVKNIVRSTATPGAIRVRVEAPGLLPGEVVIRSKAPSAATGPIREAPLSDRGRNPVTRNTAFDPVNDALAGAPSIARIEDENHSFPAMPRLELRARLDKFVRARNPGLGSADPTYEAFLDRLTDAVERTNRQLIPDDYNFSADSYNDAARLAHLLAATKLHPLYRRQLGRYYADRFVRPGRPLDVEAESARLRPLLQGSRLVRLELGAATPIYDNVDDLFRVGAASLAELLGKIYPEFAALPPAQRERAAAFVTAINPISLGAGFPPARGEPFLVPSLQVMRDFR